MSEGAAPRSALRTIRLDIAYEGTRYHGFGLQPGRVTIQEVLEEALARSLGEQVRVTGSNTAYEQVAYLSSPRPETSSLR